MPNLGFLPSYTISEKAAKYSGGSESSKVKVKFTLEQVMNAQTGSRGTLFWTSALDEGWVINTTSRPLYPWARGQVPTVQVARWARGPVWTGAENVSSTGIRSRTVHPKASHSTDYATPANLRIFYLMYHILSSFCARIGVAMKAYGEGGGRGSGPLYLNPVAKWRWVVKITRRPL